jgi:hypothetical protein
MMFEEIKYRLTLRKYLRGFTQTLKSHESVKDCSREDGEPDIQRAMAKEQNIRLQEIGVLMTKRLVYKARLHCIPIPDDAESWFFAKYLGEKFLSPEAVRKLHLEIRAEEKANWDYWQSRVTFTLALIGSIFGMLAFFRK